MAEQKCNRHPYFITKLACYIYSYFHGCPANQTTKPRTSDSNSLLGVLKYIKIISVLVHFASENLCHIFVALAIRKLSPIFYVKVISKWGIKIPQYSFRA